MNQTTPQGDSTAWIFYCWASFVISIFAMGLGIYYAPVDLWVRGFLAIGTLFVTGASFTLAKTLRDQHEARKIAGIVQETKSNILDRLEGKRAG